MGSLLPTKELIRRWMAFKPVTAQTGQVNATVEDLRQYLKGAGVHTILERLPDGRLALFAATERHKTVDVLLNAHLDVVPAEDSLFTLREEGGMLYGRGVHDCLGNSALAANLLARLNGKASVGAIFSTDEEAGGASTAFMVAKGYAARRLVLVLDGAGNAVTVAQKGILNVRLVARGKACHAAEPWKGQNAIDLLLDGYGKVRGLFSEARAGDEWHTTLAATVIQAGSVHNRVPETAELNLNIRFVTPGEDGAILARLRELSGLEVAGVADCQPVSFSGETPALREFIEFMGRFLGREIAVQRMNGATDARHFVNGNVPIAIIGVPGAGAHAVNESLEADALGRYEEMLVAYLSGGAAPAP
ncbi:MAG: M20/M25/M40 family metallo-hydrolase [Lentisphaeria bacterium]|jgi:succinyl-diaminopimelate desuccinylase